MNMLVASALLLLASVLTRNVDGGSSYMAETSMWDFHRQYEISYEIIPFPHRVKDPEVCNSEGCKKTANQILGKMNKHVHPCDNFYEFTCGNFISSPEPLASEIQITNNEIFKNQELILESSSTGNEPRFSRLAKDFYKACVDKDKTELDMSYIKEILQKAGGWPVLEGDQWDSDSFTWEDTTLKLYKEGFVTSFLLSFIVAVDPEQNNKNIIMIDQAGFHESRVFFPDCILDVLMMDFKVDREQAKTELNDSIEFEKQVFEIASFKKEKTDQRMTVQELKEKYPSIAWDTLLSHIFPHPNEMQFYDIIVREPSYITKLENLLSTTPKRTLANYIMWWSVLFALPYLPWKPYHCPAIPRPCADLTYESFPFAVTSMYVHTFFKNDTRKFEVGEIVKNTRKELVALLKNSYWLDRYTRRNAVKKAESMTTAFVGYPELDIKDLEHFHKEFEVNRENFLESVLNANKVNIAHIYSSVTKFVPKNHWTRYAATKVLNTNAEYKASLNSFFVQIGFLHDPLMSNDRPNYMKYGYIGFTIGHELIHGFDNQGSKYDNDGLADWWSPPSWRAFEEKMDCLIHQYGEYSVKGKGEGGEEIEKHINGTLTLGENISDNGGAKLAYRAYNRWVRTARRRRPEPRLPGLEEYTPQQMFWISAASFWCTKNDQSLTTLQSLIHDVHTPAQFRVIGTFSNSREFARDFNCPLGSYMNPVEKCEVW